MSALEGTFKVKELIDLNVLDKPMDGNHGSYHPTADEYVKDGVPFVMASDLVNGRVDYNRCKKISKDRADRLQKGFSIDGDVLLTHKATIGRTAIVSGVGKEKYIMLTPQVTYYRVKNSEALDNRYLKYYFDSIEFQNLFLQWSGGGSTRAYLGITAQLELPIKLPNIKKQREIVSAIDPINQKIEFNNQINETLESMAKAIFKEWFIDFGPVRAKSEGKKPFGMDDETAALFPDSFKESDLGPIPKGWKTGKLEEIAEVIGGGTPSTSENSYYTAPSTGISWISPKDLSGYSWKYISHGATDITEFGLKNSSARLLPTGTVLFSSRAPIGYVAVAEKDLCTNQGFKSLIPKNGSNTDFLYYLAKANVELIESRASGSTFKEISGNGMKELPVVIPTNQILDSFTKVTSEFSKLQKELRHETNNLKVTRDLLLPKLISGEISLNDV